MAWSWSNSPPGSRKPNSAPRPPLPSCRSGASAATTHVRRPPTPLPFHALALLAPYLAALWLYLDRVPGTPGGLALASWLLLPLAELGAYVLLGSALLRGDRGRWRLPAFAALALLVTLAWLGQLAALVIGNAYISVLAL